ncbi:beta-lactamase-like protein [Irpex rosettiformis]|uniref:Beta-lactamase-like protein n=1 Tax=Irpex rosettiformis TaxID=378272 RepID=A0ACB8UFL9_9APHY|nr:beta-lactamase-like protein [Irpex rosettiformis]
MPTPTTPPITLKLSALLTTFIHLPFHTVFQDCLDSGYPDSSGSYVPVFSFLIEHPSEGKVLFDLGVRKNAEGYPPHFNVPRVSQSRAGVSAKKDVAELLVEGGIDPKEIKHVIYSHLHWDHTGNPGPFVNADIVVGGEARSILDVQTRKPSMVVDEESNSKEEEETKTWVYPTNPLGTVLEFPRSMPVRFVDFVRKPDVEDEDEDEKTSDLDLVKQRVISPFMTFTHAVDFFDDGSLFLVDTPGHYPGHISALVRVSPSDSGSELTSTRNTLSGVYVFLGGDCCHNRQCYVPGGTREMSGKIQWDVGKARESVGRLRMLCEVCQGRRRGFPADGGGAGRQNDDTGECVCDVVVILAHEAERLEEGMPLFPQDLREWVVHRARKERVRGG